MLDTEAWFGRSAPVVLEIGSGTGTSTLAMAKAEPHIDVVAVEVYRRGLAQLLSAIDREAVTNIRLVRGDGVDVLEHMFGPESLTGVRVFFPDPWPKARHHKRRLLQPDTVALIADRLRPGGVLHAATDHAGYAEQIAEVGDAEPRLRASRPADATADLGGTTDHQVRGEGARRRQRGRRTGLGEAPCACMSMTADEPTRRDAAAGARHVTRVLLVWDAPNLDMGLGSILGGRPTAAHRPRFDALGRWLLARTAELSAGQRPDVSVEPEATVFTNIAPGSADVVRPWVEALRNVGFAVFAKPKIDEDSDVDVDMLNHIALRRGEGLAGRAGGLGGRTGVPSAAGGHRPRGHPRSGARISRTCELGASLGYFGVRRPGGHPWCLPGAATANRPRFATRAGGLAAAVPAAVLATDVACVNN